MGGNNQPLTTKHATRKPRSQKFPAKGEAVFLRYGKRNSQPTSTAVRLINLDHHLDSPPA
jgi:hypothetical protein